MFELRRGTVQEKPLEASKWLQNQALLDVQEMENLLAMLGDFQIFSCGTVKPKGEHLLSKETFLKCYHGYIDALKNGIIPHPKEYQSIFSTVFTTQTDVLYAIDVGQGKELIRLAKPAVQLQAHQMDYSSMDHKFRSMVFGQDSIPWGIQFSYPQIYQNHETGDIIKAYSADIPNAKLFMSIQRWLRQNTLPTPVTVDGISSNLPMRIGRTCLVWINQHPQLIKKKIFVGREGFDKSGEHR